jgi:hypothetical protein
MNVFNVLNFLFIFGDTPGSCLLWAAARLRPTMEEYGLYNAPTPPPFIFFNDGTRHTALPSRLSSRLSRSLLSNIHSEQTLCAAGPLGLSALN